MFAWLHPRHLLINACAPPAVQQHYSNATRYMAYMRQFAAALKPGGTFLLMDHDPDDEGVTTRSADSTHKGMLVVPMVEEVRAFLARSRARSRARSPGTRQPWY